MASPPYSREEPSSREKPSSPLPAPYQDPWSRLATDLAAVVATARLKARELWRLNGEGTLATPVFWPRGLAPLFWPLLLALGLLLMVGLALRLPGGWGGPPADPAGERPAAVAPDALQADQLQGDVAAAPPPSTLVIPEDTGLVGGPAAARRPVDSGGGSPGRPSRWPWRQGHGGSDAEGAVEGAVEGASGGPDTLDGGAGPEADPVAGATARIVGGSSLPLGSGDGPAAGSVADTAADSAADSAANNAADSAAVPAASPLAELVGADPPAWVLALEQRPAEGLLRLRLAGGYGALPLADRRRLAERWLERARELGYERLELVDPAGRLLARPARVGSGMILLDAVSTPA